MEKNETSKKFSFLDMITSERNGAASATGFSGILLIIVSTVVFLIMIVYYFCEPSEASNIQKFLDVDVIMLSVGATMLTARKVSGAISSNRNYNVVKSLEDSLKGEKDYSDRHSRFFGNGNETENENEKSE